MQKRKDMYKTLKTGFLFFIILVSGKLIASPTLVVTPIVAIPTQVVENTTVSNIKYQIHNASLASTYSVTFDNLSTLGKTFTTTCASLAPGANCTVNIIFQVPSLPAGKTSEFYPHTFFVLGAPQRVPYPISTTIIQSQTSIQPTVNVSLQSPGVCTGTFTVTLTDSSSMAHVYNNVACGNSTLSPALAGANYMAHIDPATVTSGGTYDAPADFSYHLAKAGDAANFVYTLNASVAVNTNLTMPNVGPATSAITCVGAKTYGPHNQAAGTNSFDTMNPGSYTCTAANYTGTDGLTYVAAPTNPYAISSTSAVIAMSFSAKAPTTQHVFTNLTLPNLASGNTVACTLSNATYTYGPHNQAAGNTSFDGDVEDASDYNFSCAPYTVGPDTYSMTSQSNVLIDSTHTTLTGIFSKNAPPGANYPWTDSHVASTANSCMFAVYLGGGSTTSILQISSNPIPDEPLKEMVAAYQLAPVTLAPNCRVKNFPTYMAIGSIGQPPNQTPDPVTTQLIALKIDSSFHYEGNGSGDRGCFWDDTNCPNHYTPQVDALATQEAQVKTATGKALVNGTAFYTIDYSDGAYAILQDTENDTNLTAHLYNLMYEAYRMEHQFSQGNPMVILLNADATEPFQNCSVFNCATAWKPGIFQSGGHVVSSPNLQTDVFAAIDRMVAQGYLTSGNATAMKADFTTNAIATPPVASGRTVPGLPEIVLSNSWIIKYLGPNVAFGYGNNEYDSANELLPPSGTQTCETASFEWLHCIQHLGYSPSQLQSAVQFEAQKYANYLKDMNLVGTPAGNYKPDFLFFDRYERDVSPAYVSNGFLMNGPDWDLYTYYITQINALTGNLPWTYWQMGGATMHIASSLTWYQKLFAYVKNLFVNEGAAKNDQVDYLAPKAQVGQHKNIKVNLKDTALINVTLAAPSTTGAVQITMQDWDPTGPTPPVDKQHTYTHNVTNGTSMYDNMFYATGEWAHSYWLIGATYVGSDGKTYYAQCVNPYGLGKNTPAFSVSYAYPVPLTTSSWTPNIGTNTPSITISGSCYSYTANLKPGQSQPFVGAAVPGVYSSTGASYTGTDGATYFWVTQLPTTVNQTGNNNILVAYGRLADTFGNWFFGTPGFHNDFSNIDPNQSLNYVVFTPTMNSDVYYTKNSNVKNAIDYLKLTSASP